MNCLCERFLRSNPRFSFCVVHELRAAYLNNDYTQYLAFLLTLLVYSHDHFSPNVLQGIDLVFILFKLRIRIAYPISFYGLTLYLEDRILTQCALSLINQAHTLNHLQDKVFISEYRSSPL